MPTAQGTGKGRGSSSRARSRLSPAAPNRKAMPGSSSLACRLILLPYYKPNEVFFLAVVERRNSYEYHGTYGQTWSRTSPAGVVFTTAYNVYT